MRLKKVFAGALAAAMLVCAVAVPAFAAEGVEQENCLSSSYVQMNIPYADFYKAAGVDNASEIDAVTSATKSKTRAGKLAAGSYHVNTDGTDITGVSCPVKVLTPWALKNAKQVTDADSYDITVTLKGKESTTTYTGADALFENESYAYYKLNETPAYYITAWYNLLSGKWEFGKVHATETTVEGATVELNTNGHHTTYEMKISGFDLDYKANKVYGVVLMAVSTACVIWPTSGMVPSWASMPMTLTLHPSSVRLLLRSPSTPPMACMSCRSTWRCEAAENCLIQQNTVQNGKVA